MIGCITGGMSGLAAAQETATASDTVVVTSQMQSGATKLETPDIETPQAVSIVTRQQYEEQGAISVRRGGELHAGCVQQPDRRVEPF